MDTYPRCATCKWWRPPEKESWTKSRCDKLTEEDAICGMLQSSGGEYFVETEATFGCVLWEARDDDSA